MVTSPDGNGIILLGGVRHGKEILELRRDTNDISFTQSTLDLVGRMFFNLGTF